MLFLSQSSLGDGVPLELARLRSQQLSNISYDIQFKIPSSPSSAIEGSERVFFRLKNLDTPVTFDFETSTPLTLNGKRVKTQDGHVVLPREILRSGMNSVEFKFQAGSEGIHRQENLVYTLFVPANASKTFPCFDQPDLKAIFKLRLEVPSDWSAVSQGRVVSSANQTFVFDPTRLTPTYLFAFAAGKFQKLTRRVGRRELTLYHQESDPKKVSRNVDAIFELHARALDWLEKYTKIPMPFQKFEFVLIPAFPFSGMEHPGSLFYSDKSLLLDESATQTELLNRAIVIAHETSHLWFGDLVTMRWFDDVWLKEVFANFMADKIVDPLFPKVNHDLNFFLAHYPAAYAVDRTAGANPIQQKLENLKDAPTLYGNIIYHKAPIVMRALEQIVGPKPFRKALQEYLKRYAFKNATWDDLVSVISSKTSRSLTAWNQDWVKTAGRPLLRLSNLGPTELKLEETPPWPQTLEVVLGSEKKAIPVAFGEDSNPKIPGDQAYLSLSAHDPGYGLFSPDDRSLTYYEDHLENIADENGRAAIWVTLWENVLERRLTPSQFLITALRTLPLEPQALVIDYVLGCLKFSYWALFTEDERARFSKPLEETLWSAVHSKTTSALARTAYFKAYLALFTSPEAWQNVRSLWAGETQIAGLVFSESDGMNQLYALCLRKKSECESISHEEFARIKDPERQREFSFVLRSVAGLERARDQFFQELLKPEGRKKEPWALEALSYLHHPLNGTHSESYLRPSLELLPKLQNTSGVFFPNAWLQATLRYHVTQSARETVETYLHTHPELESGLRLKLLQTSDTLMRFTRSPSP